MRFPFLTAFLLFFLCPLATPATAQNSPFRFRGIYEATPTANEHIVIGVSGTTCYFIYFDDGGLSAIGHGEINFAGVADFTSVPRFVGDSGFPIHIDFSSGQAVGSFSTDPFVAPHVETNANAVIAEGIYRGDIATTTENGSGVVLFSPSGKWYLGTELPMVGYINAIGTWTPGPLPAQLSCTVMRFAQLAVPAKLNATMDGSLLSGVITPNSPGSLQYVSLATTKDNALYRLANISTRGRVGLGADQLIAGFIIKNGEKRVLVRAIGPSLGLPPFNVPGTLANPKLELHSATDLIASNDDWQDGNDIAAIQSLNLAPKSPFESALLVTLAEGEYTVVLGGVGQTTGVALIEVYEID